MPKTEQISPQLRAKLEALPDRNPSRAVSWSKEQDAVLLLGWKKKRQGDIARLLCRSVQTCRRRFEDLVADARKEK